MWTFDFGNMLYHLILSFILLQYLENISRYFYQVHVMTSWDVDAWAEIIYNTVSVYRNKFFSHLVHIHRFYAFFLRQNHCKIHDTMLVSTKPTVASLFVSSEFGISKTRKYVKNLQVHFYTQNKIQMLPVLHTVSGLLHKSCYIGRNILCRILY